MKLTFEASNPMDKLSITMKHVAGKIKGRDGDKVWFGYFRTVSRDTLSIPTKNMDMGGSKNHTTAQMSQK